MCVTHFINPIPSSVRSQILNVTNQRVISSFSFLNKPHGNNGKKRTMVSWRICAKMLWREQTFSHHKCFFFFFLEMCRTDVVTVIGLYVWQIICTTSRFLWSLGVSHCQAEDGQATTSKERRDERCCTGFYFLIKSRRLLLCTVFKDQISQLETARGFAAWGS